MGGIDRVDDPVSLLVGGAVAEFLRQHAVRRILRGNPLAELELDRRVCLGDEAAVRLSVDAGLAAKIPHRNSIGRVGQFQGERCELVSFAQERILSPVGS